MNERRTYRNRRILIVDDNESIHADFPKIVVGSFVAAATIAPRNPLFEVN